MPLPERALISRIRQSQRRLAASGTSKSKVIVGIGDDCSVLRIPKDREILVTTDFSIEGIHFRLDWHPPEVVGHRCLARGLSDIAAMGGNPFAAFLSLALPAKVPQKWVDHFMKGMLRLAAQFDVTLAGGDTSESPAGVLADIVVVGSVPNGKAVLRSGAKPGDRVFVTGALGGSAAALGLLASKRTGLKSSAFRRHLFPEPRINVARVLREKDLAASMIDLSDGLSTDLGNLCAESAVGAETRAEAIPRASVGIPPRPVAMDLALHGGEDYELLFTARPQKRVPDRLSGIPITEIGRITAGNRIRLLEGRSVSDLKPKGWQHFSTSSAG